MSSLFYKRYIPSAGASSVTSSTDPPVHRKELRKSNNGSQNRSSGAQQPEEDERSANHGEAAAPSEQVEQDDIEVERPPKKRKKAKQTTNTSEQSPAESTRKHEKIRSKYEKAVKHSDQHTAEPDGLPKDSHDQNVDHDATSSPPKAYGLTPIPQPAPRPAAPKLSLASALPEWLRRPIKVSPDTRTPFGHLSLQRPIIEALARKDFTTALPIQAALLPMLLPTAPRTEQYSGDICISAATGSGKTLAYALPIVEGLREKPRKLLRGLVVVPTRELVTQAKENFEMCCHGTDIKVGTAVGNKSLREEQGLLVTKGERFDPFVYAREEKAKENNEEKDDLLDIDYDPLDLCDDDEDALLPGYVVDYKSKVDILICTPGRLVEHIRSTKGFTLQHVQWFVVDEADRLLDESFQQWVDAVIPELEYLPPMDELESRLNRTFRILRRRDVRKILLSATMTRDITKLTTLKLSNPRMVVLESEGQNGDDVEMGEAGDEQSFTLPETLTEIAVPVENASDKPLYLIEVLERGVQLPQILHSRNTNSSKPQRSKDDARSGDETSSSDGSESTSSSEDDDTSSSSSSSSSSSNRLSASSTSSRRNSTQRYPSPLSSSPLTHGTLLFTSSTTSATRLTHLLQTLLPHLSSQIHNLTKHTTPKSRRKALSSFHSPSSNPSIPHPSSSTTQIISLPLLITTDRSSRGLSIPHLGTVLNYDVPPSLESYIHRVGRTARAGVLGTAITLLEGQQARWFWNEVARGPQLKRGKGGSVIRGKVLGMEKWADGTEGRGRYERALAELGEAVRGEGRQERDSR